MRSLPQAKASPGFTSEVLRKVRAGDERHRPFVWRMAAAIAMAACLAVVVQIAVFQQARQQKYEALREERAKLQQELQAVKDRAKDAEPRVVLENDDGTRVIVNLDADLDSVVQPASLKTYD